MRVCGSFTIGRMVDEKITRMPMIVSKLPRSLSLRILLHLYIWGLKELFTVMASGEVTRHNLPELRLLLFA